MKTNLLIQAGQPQRIRDLMVSLAVTAIGLISTETTRAFSIVGVTLTPASPVPAGSNIVMTVNIITPSAPTWLYQPTDVSVQGNQVFVDVYPASGMLTVIGHLSTNVSLGVLPGGAYEYEVRLHPEHLVNWGVRTNRGNFFVQPSYPWTLITVTAPDPQAVEPGLTPAINPGRFTFHRAGVTNVDLQVWYAIAGTASNGMDYAPISNTVFIPAGQTAADVMINPLPDVWSEGMETVVVRVLPPYCPAIYPPPPQCYLVGNPDEAVVYIADHPPTNHPPFLNFFSPSDGATFNAPANIHLIAYAEDREDAHDLKVEFFQGNVSFGFGTFIPSLCPSPFCPNYSLVWSNVPAGDYVLTARATDHQGATTTSGPMHVRVLDLPNSPPIVTITASDPVAAEGTNCYRWPGWPTPLPATCSGTNTATFTVRRSGNTNSSLTVYYQIGGTASNGLDYATLPGTVVIPAGQRFARIVVSPVEDALPERIETVVLGLYELPTASPLPPPYVIGKPDRAAAIIVDNDQHRPATGRLPDHCFHLMQPGTNGAWFRIECSTNLIHWTPLCTNSVTDGAIHFVDPDADTLSQRFYRAVPEPAPSSE